MARLDGKVALVTGAGQGLGRACATVFARKGARVVVADINPASGEETVKIIRDAGGDAIFTRANVASAEEIKAMVQLAVDSYGGLDCAINNAVRSLPQVPLADIEEADWNAALSVNLTGVFLCMKYEIQAMLKQGKGGAIVNVGSGNEHAGGRCLGPYFAAKCGIQAMSKSASLDYAKQGIRVNVVGPGVMVTPLMEAAFADPAKRAFLMSKSPLGSFADPEKVAEAAVWLCTSEASLVMGHTLLADGGAVLV